MFRKVLHKLHKVISNVTKVTKKCNFYGFFKMQIINA